MNDRDPPTVYEVTWMSGHVERIPAHQVTWPGNWTSWWGATDPPSRRRIEFHADIDGRWTLQLSALVDDIRTIRNLATEAVVE